MEKRVESERGVNGWKRASRVRVSSFLLSLFFFPGPFFLGACSCSSSTFLRVFACCEDPHANAERRVLALVGMCGYAVLCCASACVDGFAGVSTAFAALIAAFLIFCLFVGCLVGCLFLLVCLSASLHGSLYRVYRPCDLQCKCGERGACSMKSVELGKSKDKE